MMPIIHTIMLCAVAVNCLAAVPQTGTTASPPGVLLAYGPPLGQVAEYRLNLSVQGYQTSLEERVPVKWSGEARLTEEVIARARDGAIWLRAGGTVENARDATGVFSAAFPLELPSVRFRLTPRGEVLDVSPATVESPPDARGRALLSMLPQVTPVILPDSPVCVGDTWTYEGDDTVQTSQLVSLEDGLARIRVRSRSRLSSREAVAELGLATEVQGEAAQESMLDLRLATGQVESHVGKISLRTSAKTTLDLAEGPQVFDIGSDLTVHFQLSLTRLDGGPPGPAS